MLYVYKEGMVRFCTAKYQPVSYENFNNHRIHLTNFE